jgi:hypothetical protein
VDGFELAALDPVQHGLAGDAEGFGGLIEGQPAGGDLGNDPTLDFFGDADVPRSVGRELLALEEAGVHPPIDGGAVDVEQLLGLGDRDHDPIPSERALGPLPTDPGLAALRARLLDHCQATLDLGVSR